MQEIRLVLFALFFVGFLHWAAGQRALSFTWGAMWFLLTRKPILLTWALGAAGMAWLLLSQDPPNGREPSLTLLVPLAIFCGLGFAALVVGPVWMVLCLRKPKTTWTAPDGERPLRSLDANHILHGESRGGKLHITDRALHFVPNRFVVQDDPWSLSLAVINETDALGGRLLALMDGEKNEHLLVLHDAPAFADELQGRRVEPTAF